MKVEVKKYIACNVLQTRHKEEGIKLARITAAMFFIVFALTVSPVFAKDADKRTIKVGAILGVTGPASFLGAPEAKTLEMLVDEINKKGGVKGKKIELIIKDSGASTEKAISFAKQLIEEERSLRLSARPQAAKR